VAEDRIDDIVSPKALKQLDELDAKLVRTQKQLVDSLDAALKFNGALSGSRSLKELEVNTAKAEKALLGVKQAQAQTELVELRLQEARNKIAAKREAQLNKEIALEEKRNRTILSNSKAEIAASEAASAGNLKQVSTLNAVNVARGQAANAATAESGAVKANTKVKQESNLTRKQAAFLLAEEKLNLQKNTAELKNQAREANAVKGSLEQRRAALIRLNAVYDNQSPAERASASGRRLQTIIGGLNNQVLTLEKSTGRSQRNVGNYIGQAFQGLKSIALFLPGIGLAGLFGLAIDPLFEFIKGLDLFKKKSNEATKAQESLTSAFASTEYTSAVKNVAELTTNIDLAQKGFLRKDDVLKQYNETIGLTTGQVSSLDEAEQALVKNGPAFIQMQLLKATAQLALDEAAKKRLEAQQKLIQSDEEALGGFSFYLYSNPKLAKIRERNANRQRREGAALLNQEADQYTNIYKKFQEDAAKIGAGFQGGFFGSAKDQDDAAAKALKKAEDDAKKAKEIADKAAAEKAKRLKELDEFDAKLMNDALSRLDADSQEELRQIQFANEQVLALAEKSATDQNLILARQFAEGELSAEEYAQKRLEIQRKLTLETVNEDIKGLEFLIQKRKEFGFDTAEDEKKLAELKQRLSKETTAIEIQDLEKLAEKEAELKDKRKELRQELANFGIALVQATFERQAEALTKESEGIDIRKAKEIEATERSILSEQEKADRISIINAKAQAQKEALERRQRQLDISRARFERQANIANIIGSTAAAVAKALPNIPLSILVGAIGAVQLATAVAAPLPRFEKGGKMKRTGYAEYGHGTELRIDPDGKVSLTKSTPEIGLVKAGTQFVSNKDLAKMMAKPDQLAYAGGQAIDMKDVIAATEKSGKRVEAAILSSRRGSAGVNYYSTAKGRSYLSRNL
jgi:hypothetical protein